MTVVDEIMAAYFEGWATARALPDAGVGDMWPNSEAFTASEAALATTPAPAVGERWSVYEERLVSGGRLHWMRLPDGSNSRNFKELCNLHNATPIATPLLLAKAAAYEAIATWKDAFEGVATDSDKLEALRLKCVETDAHARALAAGEPVDGSAHDYPEAEPAKLTTVDGVAPYSFHHAHLGTVTRPEPGRLEIAAMILTSHPMRDIFPIKAEASEMALRMADTLIAAAAAPVAGVGETVTFNIHQEDVWFVELKLNDLFISQTKPGLWERSSGAQCKKVGHNVVDWFEDNDKVRRVHLPPIEATP